MLRNVLVLSCLCALSTVFQTASASDFGADRHAKAGVKCESCHGEKKEIETPGFDQCKVCHDPKALAEKTKDTKPRNPHNSPHYQTDLDCVLCHVQHEKPKNYCSQCHQFDFKVK